MAVRRRDPDKLFPAITHPKKRAYLQAFAVLGTTRAAAEAAHVAKSAHFAWLLSDPDYVSAFAQARQMAATLMEDEATRRATEGVERTVRYKGQAVGTERYPSDLLLMFRLKGEMPEKYRERQDVNVSGGLRIDIGGDDKLPPGI